MQECTLDSLDLSDKSFEPLTSTPLKPVASLDYSDKSPTPPSVSTLSQSADVTFIDTPCQEQVCTNMEDDNQQPTFTEGHTVPTWCGFKVVGDNIDKTVKPRDMRFDQPSKSLHYFHVYAVKDRIDASGLSAVPCHVNPDAPVLEILYQMKMMKHFCYQILKY